MTLRGLACLAAALLGCSTSYVEGRYSCTPGEPGSCPPGWTCRESDLRCWSGPEDAAPDGSDAGTDADESADADVGPDQPDLPDETPEGGDFVPCTAEDCDDGDACNGVETCGTDGACVPGSAAPDYTECTTASGEAGGCLAGACDATLQEVAIPAGTFRRGSPWADPGAPDSPVHEVTLTAAFRIDRYEVTNARYAACVAAGVCRAPGSKDSHTRDDYDRLPEYAAYPVLFVSWDDAVEFCGWIGRRLPTEAEWERAARGDCALVAPATCGDEDLRPYPWGDAPAACDLANFDDAAGGGPCVAGGDTDAAGARPLGAGPYGADDLAGNVAEWVADFYQPDAYQTGCAAGCTDPPGPADGPERVVRGGSWDDVDTDLRVSVRSFASPGTRNEFLGFRCARNAP
ncbi:MAG: SUMF1/EgtB/PvdO family nonheme iron enzyme [Deltaproteobacteria bacterium]|nr:SUMF1/EgtB/PvdO family nonheme iron enzyme [Deltaproteobacteria bacterium]